MTDSNEKKKDEMIDESPQKTALIADPGKGAEEPALTSDRVAVADIQFRNGGKVYYFAPGKLHLKAGDHVVIETARGLEFGYCAAGNYEVSASEVVLPLREVLRIATPQDEKINTENQEKEKRAFDICQQKIQEHKLDMQLISAEYAFDGSKILFFFTADGRVDFRELVKNLASIFRTRIELRQIGVRDKAKMVGGLGICGRPFCCKEFLEEFQPVSIKMAKTQSLSLNPTKISGTCGRLMCCLKYEQNAYEDLLRDAPKNESFVDTPDGRGTVIDVNLLRQSVRVRMEDHPEITGNYKNSDIYVIRNGKGKKTDPPIPRDIAPISSRPRKEPVKIPDLLESYPEVKMRSEPIAENVETSVQTEPAERSRSRRRRRPAVKPESKTAEQKTPEAAAPVSEKSTEPVKSNRRRRRRGRGNGKAPTAGNQ